MPACCWGRSTLDIIGNFSEILQIIPILLIGLGVDYAIHMTSRYREELGAGVAVAEAASQRDQDGWDRTRPGHRNDVGRASSPTSINPVTALRDFGILAAVGITSAFILMLTVVPSVRVLLDRRARPRVTSLTRRLATRVSECCRS